MIEALAVLAFACATGVLGLGGVVLFWGAAFLIALVVTLLIALIEGAIALLGRAWCAVRDLRRPGRPSFRIEVGS